MMALRLALRDLRGGLQGARVFLVCLALGVAPIAGVGSVRVAIETGMTREAAVILGGDVELRFTYRFAEPDERAFLSEIADQVSETVDFRSMAVVGDERALTQVRGVDALWPLYGRAGTEPAMAAQTALAGADGLPGALMDPILAERLGIGPGDTFRLGEQSFHLMALLTDEPDAGGTGFALGPRTVVPLSGLEAAGLLAPGSLFEVNYRLALPGGADLAALEALADTRLAESGTRWRDTRSPAPGIEEFVERIGTFLVLVGLAGLAVGGVGISASVRSFIDRKIATIVTLRTLGAESRTVFGAYLIQVALGAMLGLAMGLTLGALLPIVLKPLIAARLPVPIDVAIYLAPLLEAALYGVIAAFLFALWPLARTTRIRAAALYRDGSAPGALPHWGYLLVTCALAVALVGAATVLSGEPGLALGVAGGVLAALAILGLAGRTIRAGARVWAPRIRNRPALRAAVAAIGGPGSEAVPVVLSLGLGLWILATMGQVDANLRAAIAEDLPEVAPSYFFVDILPEQLDPLLTRLESDPGVTRVDAAPMLRGVLTQINGRPAAEVAGDHWVIQGDRGVSYRATPPEGGEIVAGAWWPHDYTGPPQLAFAAEEAEEIGLGLGDAITVNILGRDITGEIAALIDVDFSDAGIGFILTFTPHSLSGAPHTHIATIHGDRADEAQILRDVGRDMPNVTAIRVRDAIDQIANALRQIAAVTSLGAGATLLTGFVVLIGAAAAGEPARTREAAILKTLGATRGVILLSFALRSALLGAAAGGFAVAAAGLAAWAIQHFVMESDYSFEPVSALVIVICGALASLAAGLVFALRPLSSRPARILRTNP